MCADNGHLTMGEKHPGTVDGTGRKGAKGWGKREQVLVRFLPFDLSCSESPVKSIKTPTNMALMTIEAREQPHRVKMRNM